MPTSFTIRPEATADIPSISEVNRLAFKGEGEVKLVEAVRASDYFVPELSLVAVAGIPEQVIGHILFSIVGIETEAVTEIANEGEAQTEAPREISVVPTLALAPMAVRPEYQNNGIGSALVKEGLHKATKLGYKHVVVLGHPNFYPKFGFAPSVTKEIQAPFRVPDEVFMVMELEPGSLRNIRGKVKYPPAFQNV